MQERKINLSFYAGCRFQLNKISDSKKNINDLSSFVFLQEMLPGSFHLLRLKMYFKYVSFMDLPIARNKKAVIDPLI